MRVQGLTYRGDNYDGVEEGAGARPLNYVGVLLSVPTVFSHRLQDGTLEFSQVDLGPLLEFILAQDVQRTRQVPQVVGHVVAEFAYVALHLQKVKRM